MFLFYALAEIIHTVAVSCRKKMYVKAFISLENIKSRWRSNGRESGQSVVIVVVVPRSNIRKKKQEKLEEYQGL